MDPSEGEIWTIRSRRKKAGTEGFLRGRKPTEEIHGKWSKGGLGGQDESGEVLTARMKGQGGP